jgi:hypothetical protein
LYAISELKANDSFSNNEISDWKSDGQQTCSTYLFLKPQSNSLERTFDLSRMNYKYEVFYKFTLFKFGDWNKNQFSVSIDDKQMISQTYEKNSKQICQNFDEIFLISGRVIK